MQYIFFSQEAYGGWTSALIWLLVLHGAQREVRERHHYCVDCIVGIYVGILLWRMTGFIWSAKDTSRAKRLSKLEEVQSRLARAAKDSDIDDIRKLLNEVESWQVKRGKVLNWPSGHLPALPLLSCSPVFSWPLYGRAMVDWSLSKSKGCGLYRIWDTWLFLCTICFWTQF